MIMKILSKIDAWFSALAFKWQVAIAMTSLFCVMVGIIAIAN